MNKSSQERSERVEPEPASADRSTEAQSDYLNRLVLDLQTHQAELEVQNEELRVAHEDLLEAKRQYADLFDFAPVGYVTVDNQGIILEANATMASMAGLEREALVGRNCAVLFHSDDRDVVYLFLRSLTRGHLGTCEVRLQPSDVLVTPSYVRLHGRPAVEGVAPCRIAVSDITDQHLREAEREAARDLLQRTIDGMDEPVLVVGLDHHIHFANRVAREETAANETFRESRCFHLLHGWEQACPAYGQACPLEEIARRPRTVQLLHEHVAVDGSTRTMEIVASPFYGPEGSLEGIIERSRDITERLRIEKELERAHKLESLGVLAGGVAHDFNNLLTALQGTTELVWRTAIEKRRPPPEEDLEVVRQTFARASALTKQLLTFSRGGTPVSRACSLPKLVQDASSLAAAGSNVRCRFAFPKGMRAVHVDPGQFGQVIHNIVLNAVQAMPHGGNIDISAEEVTVPSGDDPSLEGGKYAKLVIRDDGSGVPPDIADKVFEPYFTTKAKGSGLGLTIVHSIVKRHGGAIRLKSKPGEGTEFTLYVPVSSERVRRDKTSEPPMTIEGRVLVMDDEPEVRWLLEKSLERLGCTVDVAERGERALELFENARNEGRPYHAVILDLTVVDGMGGLETMRRIRALDPAVPGIVSSGYSNDPVLAHPEQHGFNARLEKPYTLDTVAAVLADVLELPPDPTILARGNGRLAAPRSLCDKEFVSIYEDLHSKRHLD
jgi:PAS domain S-box-containing protein